MIDLEAHGEQKIFDPGGTCPVERHLDLYIAEAGERATITEALLMGTDDFTTTTHALATERSSWSWTSATVPQDRDPLTAVNPGYIRALYSAWAQEFLDYDVPIAVDLTSGHQYTTDPSPSIAQTPDLLLPISLPPTMVEQIERALALAMILHGTDTLIQKPHLQSLFTEAYTLADQDYGVGEAVAAGKGYVLPTGDLLRDSKALLQCNGDLAQMAQTTREEQAPVRLTPHRIDLSLDRPDVHGSIPRSSLHPELLLDFVRLYRLASSGIPLPTYDGFTPNGGPGKIRPLYKQVHSCVNRSLVDLWKDSLVFLIPTALVCRVLCHYTTIGWTTKSGKKQGRQLFDAKDSSNGSPLNPTDRKSFTERLRDEWGPIENASLSDICKMILEFEDRMAEDLGTLFNPRDVVLFKVDLSRAFHLLSFDAQSVPLLACQLYQDEWPEFSPELLEVFNALGVDVTAEITRSWSVVYGTGSFGLIVLPFVFAVVTRCLLHLIRCAIHGAACSYVDDSMAVTMIQFLHHDIAAVCEVAELLLGPHAVEWTKWFYGRRLVMIGWEIDLDTRRVTISRRNFLKTLYGFFNTDVDARVKVRWANKLASWSARYTQVLRALQPCTVCLFHQFAGMTNMEATMDWKADARVAVLIWRSTLLLLHFLETSYALPLDSFRFRLVLYELEYDASLTGVGFLLFRLVDGQRSALIACGSVEFPFDCKQDSSYQNTCEFTAVLLGVLALAQLGARHVSIRLCGDSRTSLAWGKDGHFSGRLCQRASLVYLLAGLLFDIVVTEAVHIPGVDNYICDALSRQQQTAVDFGYDYRVITDFEPGSTLLRLLSLIDPTVPAPLDSEDTFTTFWRDARSQLSALELESSLLPSSP